MCYITCTAAYYCHGKQDRIFLEMGESCKELAVERDHLVYVKQELGRLRKDGILASFSFGTRKHGYSLPTDWETKALYFIVYAYLSFPQMYDCHSFANDLKKPISSIIRQEQLANTCCSPVSPASTSKWFFRHVRINMNTSNLSIAYEKHRFHCIVQIDAHYYKEMNRPL